MNIELVNIREIIKRSIQEVTGKAEPFRAEKSLAEVGVDISPKIEVFKKQIVLNITEFAKSKGYEESEKDTIRQELKNRLKINENESIFTVENQIRNILDLLSSEETVEEVYLSGDSTIDSDEER